MRSIGVRHLVARPRKGGKAWYWQPTKTLLEVGFIPRRLPDDLPAAIREAEVLNGKVDAWRRGAPPPPAYRPDGLEALDAAFQKDEAFKSLADRTQADYCRNIKPAIAWAGDVAVTSITRRAVKEYHRGLAEDHGAATARNRLAALRRLLTFGADEEWIPKNPALALRLPTPTSRARVWTIAERDQFCTAAEAAGRPSMALAVMLGWCLGQRPADLRILAWSAYDGRTIRLRQGKTDQPVAIPVLPELRALLARTPKVGSTQMVVSETTKRPYQESAFQHLFAELRQKGGLPADLQFRDLRRTLATALGSAGCTDDQIRAITGHRTRAVVAVYVRPDDTYAEGAMKRLRAAGRKKPNGKTP